MNNTTTNKTSLKCLSCNHDVEMEIKSRIDSEGDKEDVKRILDGSFFIKKCVRCAKDIIVKLPVGYHNAKLNKDILFLPMDSQFKQQSINIPSNARVTYDLITFIEKVRIAEMELDDKIVELVKVVAYNQVAQLGKVPNEALEGIGCWIKDDKFIDLDLRCGGRHYLLEVPHKMYVDIDNKFSDALKDWREPKVVDMNWALTFLNAMLIDECTTSQDEEDDWDEIIF